MFKYSKFTLNIQLKKKNWGHGQSLCTSSCRRFSPPAIVAFTSCDRRIADVCRVAAPVAIVEACAGIVRAERHQIPTPLPPSHGDPHRRRWSKTHCDGSQPTSTWVVNPPVVELGLNTFPSHVCSSLGRTFFFFLAQKTVQFAGLKCYQ